MEYRTDGILRILRKARGIDLGGYREKVFERILGERLESLGIEGVETYTELLEKDFRERDRLVDALLIRVSEFFRDPLVFETLSAAILPEVLQNKRDENKREIRVWCAGCATGEEAYSIALLLQEALWAEEGWDVHVFATDISERALSVARRGVYSGAVMGNVKLRIKERYFLEEPGGFRIRPEVAGKVHFSVDDLMDMERIAPAASIFGEFDMVLCRNVLIYYELSMQERILAKLCKTIGSRGVLVLGDSESLQSGLDLPLNVLDHRSRIYGKREV